MNKRITIAQDGQNQMTAEIIDFYSFWKKDRSNRIKALGFEPEVIEDMIRDGYDPLNADDVEKYWKELEKFLGEDDE